ncbi:hypothetical protein BDV59DRAFT_43000 [Aspergillus ambiguus]|uniref:fungal specific transcription factor domain-containing protein n=1 Tax=Aspergillus ambiguus TaxID=176160 RepID=UPI003CCE0EBE
MLTAAAEMGKETATNVAGFNLTPQSQSPALSQHNPLAPSLSLRPTLPRLDLGTGDRASDPTLSRVLNNVTVVAEEIDEIFELFFHQYAQFVPILDPQTTPNAYYAHSPFLFWSVIWIACRTYPRNPTLYVALAPSIMEMACLSITSASAVWHIIQGLVLVLSWPFPKDTTRPELTFPLAGMLLHIAMQNGFHIPMSSHEFARKKIPMPSEADMIRRAELWAHCIIVYQRACVMKGHPPRCLGELEHDLSQRQVLFQKISPQLALQIRCQELVARCSAAVLELGVRSMTLEQERSLDILLRAYESQVADLEAQITSVDDRIHTTLCLLCIQSLHFLKNYTMLSTNCSPRIVNTACMFINLAENIGQRLPSLPIAPFHIYFGLLLSSAFLLRILKGSTSQGLDVDRARISFFTAINLGKQMTVGNNDIAAKMVLVMNQLWNSNKAFRKPDGVESTALRIRSRLVVSPVIDAVWWWRDEFDPHGRFGNPPQGTASDGTHTIQDHTAGTSRTSAERQDPYLFDDQFLADFEWALGDEGLFLSTEPYGTWPSTGAALP